MNKQANVREFKALEAAIAASEADVEAKKWRQAELTVEAIAAGVTQVAYAEAVGKSRDTISRYVRVWRRWGDATRASRPRFADAIETVMAGSEEIISRADATRLQKERQVPTRHDDKVVMAQKLLSDPKVAKAAVQAVLADTSNKETRHAARVIDNVVYDRNAAERAKQRERAAQARADGAMPLPAYMAKMVVKISDWGGGLAGLNDDDWRSLPDGPGRDLVIHSLKNLIATASRIVELMEGKPALTVIDGRSRRVS